MEASSLTHASRLGLLGRRSPLLRLQGDERLIALVRDGQERAFETLVERYQARLLAFCRGMLPSTEDAEDVLQEVFVAAHKAILADNRAINARPWLYRIARNRCLNHLRKPVAEGQDTMDDRPHMNGVSAAERVQTREEFRALITDVQDLPETQRTALLLREIDALAYEEIAVAMDTSVSAVKSLLVRARMSLADSSQGRHLTCDEVHLELAEAAEGLRKASAPARAHLRRCERCRDYRAQLRRNGRSLAALAPLGPLAALHGVLTGKLSLAGGKLALGGGSGTGTGLGASAGGAAGATGTAAGGAASTGAAAGAGTAVGGGGLGLAGTAAAGGLGGALGSKAAAGVASVALLTAGAVEVNRHYGSEPATRGAPIERSVASAHAAPASRKEGTAPGTATSHRDADAQATEGATGSGASDTPATDEAGAAGASTAATPPEGSDGSDGTKADEAGAAGGAAAGGPATGTGYVPPNDGGVTVIDGRPTDRPPPTTSPTTPDEPGDNQPTTSSDDAERPNTGSPHTETGDAASDPQSEASPAP